MNERDYPQSFSVLFLFLYKAHIVPTKRPL